MMDIFYMILAFLGLGFLIFIHELGHYFMAKKKKMKIEVFSIGFGPAIKSWKRHGVKWQIAILPIGGYVKIAGMQKEGSREPYEIANGFFHKKPKDRIKVALMGPLVNFIFALFAFSLIWICGGRDKPFSEFTKKIGFIEHSSKLYEKDLRPGDEITSYAGRPFSGFKDVLYASILKNTEINITGNKVDYVQNVKIPFNYFITPYKTKFGNLSVSTIGVFASANYLIYDQKASTSNGLKNKSLEDCGIQNNDKIVWANGEFIFSTPQLNYLVNGQNVFLTVVRNGKILHLNIPRIQIGDYSWYSHEKDEIDDWRHDVKIKDKIESLYFIPYSINENGFVERSVLTIDEAVENKSKKNGKSIGGGAGPGVVGVVGDGVDGPDIKLKKGDLVLAVDGVVVERGSDILSLLQKRKILIIVQRDTESDGVNNKEKIYWNNADEYFDSHFNGSDINILVKTIGSDIPLKSYKNYYLLNPIEPKTLLDLDVDGKYVKKLEEFSAGKDGVAGNGIESGENLGKDVKVANKKIVAGNDSGSGLSGQDVNEKINGKEKRRNGVDGLFLGMTFKDKLVKYNPNPLVLFRDALIDTSRTLYSLVTGSLNPKFLSGPIGIVKIIQHGWSVGIKESLFFLGTISLYLGFFNLLPIPALDGGHILFSVIEWVTKKRIKSKTMDRWMFPFIALLVLLFVYVTYQDILRIIQKIF